MSLDSFIIDLLASLETTLMLWLEFFCHSSSPLVHTRVTMICDESETGGTFVPVHEKNPYVRTTWCTISSFYKLCSWTSWSANTHTKYQTFFVHQKSTVYSQTFFSARFHGILTCCFECPFHQLPTHQPMFYLFTFLYVHLYFLFVFKVNFPLDFS